MAAVVSAAEAWYSQRGREKEKARISARETWRNRRFKRGIDGVEEGGKEKADTEGGERERDIREEMEDGKRE